jgi:hypothetical protein
VLYTGLVAVAQSANARELLAFPRILDSRPVESDVVIDIASDAERAAARTPSAVPASGS